MSRYTNALRSRQVLVQEYLDTAEAAGNEAHARLLRMDLDLINTFLSWENPTEVQEQRIRNWMGLVES